MNNYIPLKNLEVYQLAKKLSQIGWDIYDALDTPTKIIMGNQFIESTDSVGANITEGYRRFHYLDQVKFYYNARASLAESNDHWLELLFERKKIDGKKYKEFKVAAKNLEVKLNNFIRTTSKSKTKETKTNDLNNL